MKRTRACAGILLAVLWLLVVMQASARRVDFGRSYSLGAHGGVRDKEHWNAGMQALTLHGPGDSGYILFHMGTGLDAGYARMGDAHQIRLVGISEILFFLVFVQIGAGAAIDLEHPSRTGADLVLVPGLRIFLGDEYQSPALSAGARLDWIIGRRFEFVPSFFASISFHFNAW